MDTLKKKVEAVLFTVGKEITVERVASLCSLDMLKVQEIIQQLAQEYRERDHSLQIVEN